MTEHPFVPEHWENPTHLTHDPLNPGTICPHGYKHPSPHPCPECGFAPASPMEMVTYQIEGEAYRIASRSLHPGALFAWEWLDADGAWQPLGCVCHTLPTNRAPQESPRLPRIEVTRNDAGNVVVEALQGDGRTAGVFVYRRRSDVERALFEAIEKVL
jgi:hypothetical protein